MTATIRDPHRQAPRRRLRLASMESLGFIDRPGMATTWVSPLPRVGRHETAPSESKVDPFSDWKPTEMGGRLFGTNVRWSLLLGLLLIAGGAVLFGYWLYQRPEATAAQATENLMVAAAPLESHIEELRHVNAGLSGQAQPQDASATLLAAHAAARQLFEASGLLPGSETTNRLLSADAAGHTLEATRLLSDAVAFREAVIPILVVPDLETDPALIDLDDAVREFGDWRLRFDSVRSVLPAGTMSALSADLEMISADLDAVQNRYVDSLRDDDQVAAIASVEDLSDRLAAAESSLYAGLESVQARVTERLDEATESLGSLLG